MTDAEWITRSQDIGVNNRQVSVMGSKHSTELSPRDDSQRFGIGWVYPRHGEIEGYVIAHMCDRIDRCIGQRHDQAHLILG